MGKQGARGQLLPAWGRTPLLCEVGHGVHILISKGQAMEIKWTRPGDLIPYGNNTKTHPPEQVDRIAESIRQFGWQQPIVVDRDNVVIIGHGRLMAAKQLLLDTVPVVCADDLTAEQAQALRLADNKTNESPWDFGKLEEELAALSIAGVDMSTFGFEDSEPETADFETRHEIYKEQEQFSDSNILNLGRAQYVGVGEFEIPEILPEPIPNVAEWIGFNYMLSEKEPEGKGVHCFVNDYQFERLWNNPDAYIDKLKRFECVASPDFSPYGDMPICLQVFNHYRKHWVARYLQENGVKIVPTIRASTDRRSLKFYLDGEPHGGAVIISSMYTNTEDEIKLYREEYETMAEKLQPERVYIYGKLFGFETGDVVQVETFTKKRFGR